MCHHVYLLLNSVSLSHHGVEVVTFRNAVDHQLLNLHLQVSVGALQCTHLEEEKIKRASFSKCFSLLLIVSFTCLHGAKWRYTITHLAADQQLNSAVTVLHTLSR